MFCALLTSRYQVSVYRTIGPLVFLSEENVLWICFHTSKINYTGKTFSLKDINTYFTNEAAPVAEWVR